MVQSAPRIHNLVGGDVDFVELGVQHEHIRVSALEAQVARRDVVRGREEGVAVGDMAFVQVDIRLPRVTVRGNKVVLQRDGIDFAIGVVENMNGSIAITQLHHVSGPEGNHILVKETLDLEVGRDLLGALVHQIPVFIVNERRSACLFVAPRTDEDVSRVCRAGFGDLQLRRLEGDGGGGEEGPVVGHRAMEGEKERRTDRSPVHGEYMRFKVIKKKKKGGREGMNKKRIKKSGRVGVG